MTASSVATRRRLALGAVDPRRWVGAALLVTATAYLAAGALAVLTGWPDRPAIALAVGLLVVPLALVLGQVERTRALGAHVLAHTVVACGLLLLATALYLAVVVGFDGTPSEDEGRALGLSLAAAAVIAVLAMPARRRLEDLAQRWVHGDQAPPEVALETFASRMSRAVPMDELLLQLAEVLRKTLGLTRAEIWTGADGVLDLAVSVPDRRAPRITLGPEERSVAARAPVAGNAWMAVWVPALLEGRDDQVVRVAALAHLGELLGLIVTERAAGGAGFGEDEDRVLTDIARQLGLALHNVRLDTALQASLDELQVRNAELIASRSRIVAAADESRRRIERNLHDGAQQHLVALAVKVGLARQLLDAEPKTAATMLEELRSDVQATLAELRELAHGIYPPLLRSQGLPDALAAAAGRATLPTTVRAEDLPRFSPDAEAAVYFCCLEAIQNAGKHAGEGASILVTVAHDDDGLRFEVTDDGAGFDPAATTGGDGFVNMADRLGAMGGHVTVTSAPGAGTTVAGAIPDLAPEEGPA